MIRVGRWASEHKRSAAAILNKQTCYLDEDDTYHGIKHVDMVPNLLAQNLTMVDIGKDFMLKHDYIKNDFDIEKWAAPEFLAHAGKEILEDAIKIKKMEKIPNKVRQICSANTGLLQRLLWVSSPWRAINTEWNY